MVLIAVSSLPGDTHLPARLLHLFLIAIRLSAALRLCGFDNAKFCDTVIA
jgi:hypothetical protein